MCLIECAMQMQGNMAKRPANMWGAVPQHHHAVPPAQAQHSQAQHSHAQHSRAQHSHAQHSHAQHSQAQAQHFALAQAAAQAQAMRHAEGVSPPPPPPNPQMGAFGHGRWGTLHSPLGVQLNINVNNKNKNDDLHNKKHLQACQPLLRSAILHFLHCRRCNLFRGLGQFAKTCAFSRSSMRSILTCAACPIWLQCRTHLFCNQNSSVNKDQCAESAACVQENITYICISHIM